MTDAPAATPGPKLPASDGLPATLAESETLGPFAAVTLAAGSRFQPFTEALANPETLARRVESTRISLRTSGPRGNRLDQPVTAAEIRVAASVMQLGLTARLVTVPLATATLGGWVPDLAPARVWWDPGARNPVPLALPEPVGCHADTPESLSGAIHALVIEPLVAPLVELVHGIGSVSTAVLWGNVWSGLVGALAPMATHRPDLAPRARTIVAALLALESRIERSGAGPQHRHPGTLTNGAPYHRETCCLIYRLSQSPDALREASTLGREVCADCVLAPGARGLGRLPARP